MAKSKGARGKQFEADVLLTFRNAGAWVEKIPDKLVSRGPDLPMMSVEGPPDIVALLRGKPWLIECKARGLAHSKAIEFDRLKDHQLEQLLAFARNGGHAYIAVLWYGRTNASPETVALLIPVTLWHHLKEHGRKLSLNIKDVIDEPGVLRLHWVGRSKEGVGPWTLKGSDESSTDFTQLSLPSKGGSRSSGSS